MTLLTVKDLSAKYRDRPRSNRRALIASLVTETGDRRSYDIYLAHGGLAPNLLQWIRWEIEASGLSVFVESFTLAGADAGGATNGQILGAMKEKMRKSRCLLFAARSESDTSPYLAWQSGYFECLTGRVAVLPVFSRDTATLRFQGRDILSLYPYVGFAETLHDRQPTLWVMQSPTVHVNIEHWLSRHFLGFEDG